MLVVGITTDKVLESIAIASIHARNAYQSRGALSSPFREDALSAYRACRLVDGGHDWQIVLQCVESWTSDEK